MESLTKNLFYSESESILFWVAGYCASDNDASVVKKIENLQNEAKMFADHVGADIKDVRTFYNEHPPRYQYMRIFYLNEWPAEKKGEAFTISADKGWTMSKWILY